ncbi:MAG: hypothetical protein IJ938_01605 [Clostridia bacterium]|nr:hypothetical protein [Clostridia bacterium]
MASFSACVCSFFWGAGAAVAVGVDVVVAVEAGVGLTSSFFSSSFHIVRIGMPVSYIKDTNSRRSSLGI